MQGDQFGINLALRRGINQGITFAIQLSMVLGMTLGSILGVDAGIAVLRSREGLGFCHLALLQEAARQRTAQERLTRAAADRAAMLVQVAEVAQARMKEQLEATRSQANQRWAQRQQVGKFANPLLRQLPHQACSFSGVAVRVPLDLRKIGLNISHV